MHKKIKMGSNLTNLKVSVFPENKIKLMAFILLFFCLIFLILFILTSASLDAVKKEHSIFVSNSSNTISSLNNAIFDLTKTNSNLTNSLIDLNIKYTLLSSKTDSLESSYADLKKESDLTIAKIEDYQTQIQSSLDWFNLNSTLGETHENILLNLKSSCKKETSKNCQINLDCFSLVNSKFINYKYKDDLATSDSLDKLQSIEDFIKNKGGDCEDFSLFFKAEYNSLVDSCNGKKPNLFAWVEKKNSTFWSNFENTWYMDNATIKYLDSNNIFPVVVCGSIYDLQTDKINGHCVLAFVSKKIIYAEDIFILNFAELVEPQTGKYLGFVGSDSGIFLVSDNSFVDSYIDTLITDEDFFIYKNNEWVNYAKFGVELSNDKNSLEQLLKD
jgi:hypothetical protein